jgi:DNA-binding NarL/FixJ family response regulator
MAVTILIVDDNAQFRVLLRDLVAAESDLQVVGEAADGAEAIHLALELRPDIMLLDLVMPQINGLEVLKRIKAERPEIKVIIVTMHTEEAYRQAAEASGADAFLLKKTLGTALDVRFISSLPVMQGNVYKAWVDSKPVQMVRAGD